MLRDSFKQALKTSMLQKEAEKTTTIRMILSAVQQKDLEARDKGNLDGANEEALLSMLQSLIKQRNDSIKLYQEAGRAELAEKEQREIEVIQTFLPQQLSEEEVKAAIAEAVKSTGADSIKDMGKIMAELKAKYTGKMDFSKASQMIKSHF